MASSPILVDDTTPLLCSIETAKSNGDHVVSSIIYYKWSRPIPGTEFCHTDPYFDENQTGHTTTSTSSSSSSSSSSTSSMNMNYDTITSISYYYSVILLLVLLFTSHTQWIHSLSVTRCQLLLVTQCYLLTSYWVST